MTQAIRSVRTVSAVDAVGDDIRRRLFEGELTGGALVTEAVVAGEYQVSRSTAKAAIEKLTGEGLLERSANRSARVPVLTAADVRDIYRTRLRLESAALRELAADARAPQEAVAANARVRAAGETAAVSATPKSASATAASWVPAGAASASAGAASAPAASAPGGAVLESAASASAPSASVASASIASVEPDMRFHAVLVEAVGSERLQRMYGSLVDEVRLCMSQVQGRSLLAVEVIAAEHDEILARLVAGDGEGAVRVLEGHLGRASARLEAALTTEP